MLVLTGKMCSGKDTIKKELVKLGLKSVTAYTTRPMRDGEINGETYHFIPEKTFLQKIREGDFVECTYYNVANGDTWFYGSCGEDYLDNGVIILNPNGLKDLIYLYGYNPIVFYIDAPDEIIEERLIKRGDNPDEAKRRLLADFIDFKDIGKMYDAKFLNDGKHSPKWIAELIYDTYETLRRIK